MEIANRPANFVNVRTYLTSAYVVSDEDVLTALANPLHREVVDRATSLASFSFYPGDIIATIEGWSPDRSFEADDTDDDDDE